MTTFIVFPKLSIDHALDLIPKIEQWFKQNPSRKICKTEYFKVRRGFVATDILNHTVSPNKKGGEQHAS